MLHKHGNDRCTPVPHDHCAQVPHDNHGSSAPVQHGSAMARSGLLSTDPSRVHAANDFAAGNNSTARAVPSWDAWLRLLGRPGGIGRGVSGGAA